MGKADIALARYFEDEERFADLINGYICRGRQIVKPHDIYERDSRSTGLSTRFRRRFFLQKYRDSIRRIALDTHFTVVGLEHQQHIHYAMPVRVMLEDAAEYDRQLRWLQKRHRRRNDLSGSEFLSGFAASDRLEPVITIILYYGATPWDGASSLGEILAQDSCPPEFRNLINDYRIHILDIHSYTELELFHTDLKEVFGFIQNSRSGTAISAFSEAHSERLEHLEEDAYDVIAALTGSTELEERKEAYRDKEGKINMCQGIRELIAMGRQEGLRQGASSKSETVARNMFLRGMSAEDAAAICEENPELVQSWFQEWAAHSFKGV